MKYFPGMKVPSLKSTRYQNSEGLSRSHPANVTPWNLKLKGSCPRISQTSRENSPLQIIDPTYKLSIGPSREHSLLLFIDAIRTSAEQRWTEGCAPSSANFLSRLELEQLPTVLISKRFGHVPQSRVHGGAGRISWADYFSTYARTWIVCVLRFVQKR